MSNGSNWGQAMRQAAPYLDLGFYFAAAIGMFAGGGYWLDARFDTTPWLTIIGTFIAFAVIINRLVRVNAESQRYSGSKNASKKPSTDAENGKV